MISVSIPVLSDISVLAGRGEHRRRHSGPRRRENRADSPASAAEPFPDLRQHRGEFHYAGHVPPLSRQGQPCSTPRPTPSGAAPPAMRLVALLPSVNLTVT